MRDGTSNSPRSYYTGKLQRSQMVPMDYQRRRRIRSRRSQQRGDSNSMSVAKNMALSNNNSHSHPQGCFVCATPIHHTASSRRLSLSLSFAVQDSRPMGLMFNSKKTLILGRHTPALRVSIGSSIVVKSAMLQLIDQAFMFSLLHLVWPPVVSSKAQTCFFNTRTTFAPP